MQRNERFVDATRSPDASLTGLVVGLGPGVFNNRSSNLPPDATLRNSFSEQLLGMGVGGYYLGVNHWLMWIIRKVYEFCA